MLSKEPEEWENTDLGRMFALFENLATMDTDFILVEYILPKEIVKRIDLGASHPEVQLMVKMLYDNQKAVLQLDGLSVTQFARFYSSSYLSGNVAKLRARDFNEEECEFIAEAVAVFAGFGNYDNLVEEELRYGR